MTIEQIQSLITNKGDLREIVNELADYIQSNPASPGGSSYLVAEVELTDAQIKALPGTYIEVLPAPSAGTANAIMGAILTFKFSAGAYTGTLANSGLILAYGDWDDEVTNFFQMPGDANDYAVNLNSKVSTASGGAFDGYMQGCNVYNAAVKIIGYNAGTNPFGGGNAANTLKVTVYYVVVDL